METTQCGSVCNIDCCQLQQQQQQQKTETYLHFNTLYGNYANLFNCGVLHMY
jgi:hypothetical protein